jgi:16S rRNA processing protein RimM
MTGNEQQEWGYLAIGWIVGPHGIRGEVKVELFTDRSERFRPGSAVYLGNEDQAAPVEIVSARPLVGKNVMLVKLASVPDRNAAELLRGQWLLIRGDQALPLLEHENYIHDLIGLRVETAAGEELGELSEVLVTGANDVYVVSGPQGELLLPALRSVVIRVDLAHRKMVVEVPEGLRT